MPIIRGIPSPDEGPTKNDNLRKDQAKARKRPPSENVEHRYRATGYYPHGAHPIRGDVLRDNVSMLKRPMDTVEEAEDYASELQRETRGKKAGGKISASKRADGIAQRGKTRGKYL